LRVSPIKERDLVLSVLAMQGLFALSASIILLRFG